MLVTVTLTERRAVEIDEREAAKIAEQLIRARFCIGDATEITPGGRLRSWRRDERGNPEPVDAGFATPSQRAAVIVARELRA